MNEPTAPRNATANAILDAAERLFMHQGYRAVGIAELARSAGVTKPTLYYHFPDKEEIFVQMCLRLLERMDARTSFAPLAERPFREQLEAAISQMRAPRDGDFRMMLREIETHMSPPNRARVAQAFFMHMVSPVVALMAVGVAEGLLAPRPVDELAWILLRLVGAFTDESEHSPEAPIPRNHERTSATYIADLFLYGVAKS